METTKTTAGGMSRTLRLTETAIMLAAAAVFSQIKVIEMPFGGSVTLFSMLPIAIISFRYGVRWGLLTGFVGAVIQMLFGLKNLTYATSTAALIAIIMLDYIVAFVVLGVSGMFRGKIKDNGTALAAGTLVACILRYICHVISGCTVWAGVSIPTSDGLLYSLAYNAAYMIPETLITVVAAYFAASIFTLLNPEIKRVKLKETNSVRLYTMLPIALGVLLIFLNIFGMIQGEDGFDITLITKVDMWEWLKIAIIAIVAFIAAQSLNYYLHNKHENKEQAN